MFAETAFGLYFICINPPYPPCGFKGGKQEAVSELFPKMRSEDSTYLTPLIPSPREGTPKQGRIFGAKKELT